jgi:crotonobetainyl-CoA:carnitine CoA-transferase CaiB-like acyl-CoA transferase
MMEQSLFSDLLVIDCASFIAGPAAGTILADFGAQVIKIEPPGGGDGYRQLKHLPGVPTCDSNYPWRLTNRGKKSLALDLKQPEGRAMLDRLIERADVFITNYPLGVREKLALRYADISARNPQAIYASLTPYGETGPEAGNTGYDATAWWARSGLMDSVRASGDTPPGVSVPGMGDHMSACSLYGAIVTALYQRQRTGQGSMVGTSLLANGLWANGFMVQAALDGADMNIRMDAKKRSVFTQLYRCSDDRWFLLTILPQVQDAAWPRLARCLGHEEWVQDPRFASSETRHKHNRELAVLVSEAVAQQDWPYWEASFAQHGITCGRVAKAADHLEDEQVAAAGLLRDFLDDNGRTVDSPMYVQGAAKGQPSLAPGVGEHSLEILAELGIDAASIADLQARGIVGS